MKNVSKYSDERPVATHRMEAKDHGIVLRHGDGPEQCDLYGAREALVFEENGIYHLFYDGAGVKGWLACLATSNDLTEWSKKGKILDFGAVGDLDCATATAPWVIKDKDNTWHMFYVGSAYATPAPDFIPAMPYVTMKAKSHSLAGPWSKQKDIIPFRIKPGTYYDDTASPGYIIKHKDEYLQYFSAAVREEKSTLRTLGIARTRNLDGEWEIDPQPIVPLEEQIENSFLYFESTNQTWFLFTNHIGLDDQGVEFTDAIWVYWSDDPTRWDEHKKAVVLDGQNCTWSKKCIGLPSVLPVGNRLAILYDAPGGNSIAHMGRDIGLAWLELPLQPPVYVDKI